MAKNGVARYDFDMIKIGYILYNEQSQQHQDFANTEILALMSKCTEKPKRLYMCKAWENSITMLRSVTSPKLHMYIQHISSLHNFLDQQLFDWRVP